MEASQPSKPVTSAMEHGAALEGPRKEAVRDPYGRAPGSAVLRAKTSDTTLKGKARVEAKAKAQAKRKAKRQTKGKGKAVGISVAKSQGEVAVKRATKTVQKSAAVGRKAGGKSEPVALSDAETEDVESAEDTDSASEVEKPQIEIAEGLSGSAEGLTESEEENDKGGDVDDVDENENENENEDEAEDEDEDEVQEEDGDEGEDEVTENVKGKNAGVETTPLTTPQTASERSRLAVYDLSTSAMSSGVRFSSLSEIDKRLRRQLTFLKFDNMSQIQARAIPSLVSTFRDALIRAQTGSGKTLAYLVPALNDILKFDSLLKGKMEAAGGLPESFNEKPNRILIKRDHGCMTIVLSPSRELAVQTAETAMKLTQSMPSFTVAALVCGTRRKSEKASLRKGVTILVSTPGRILDHLETTSSFECALLQNIVLDEADRLLDLGFSGRLRKIVSELKDRRNAAAGAALRDASFAAALHTVDRAAEESENTPFDKETFVAQRMAQQAVARALLAEKAQSSSADKSGATNSGAMQSTSARNKNSRVTGDNVVVFDGGATRPRKRVSVPSTFDDDEDEEEEEVGDLQDSQEPQEGEGKSEEEVEENDGPVAEEAPQTTSVIELASDDEAPATTFSRSSTNKKQRLPNGEAVVVDHDQSHADDADDDAGKAAVEAVVNEPKRIMSKWERTALEKRLICEVQKESFEDKIRVLVVSATLKPEIRRLADFVLEPKAPLFEDTETAAKADREGEKAEGSGALDAEGRILEAGKTGGKTEGKGSEMRWTIPANLKQAYVKLSSTRHRLLVTFSLLKMQGAAGKKSLIFANSCETVNFLLAAMESLRWPNAPVKRSGFTKRSAQAAAVAAQEVAKVKAKIRKELNDIDDVLFQGSDDDEDVDGEDAGAGAGGFGRSAIETNFTKERVFGSMRAFGLHGSMTREDREGNLRDFNKEAGAAVLVATDVAARGLNIPDVNLVIQLDAPVDVSDYIHRVGRTSRMGTAGTAVLLLNEHETGFVDALKEAGASGIKLSPEKSLLDMWAPPPASTKFSKTSGPAVKCILPESLMTLRASDALNYLRSRFCMFIENDRELESRAEAAFLATIKTYKVYPGPTRQYFDFPKLHLGHLAASFFLKKAPNDIAPHQPLLRESNAAPSQGENSFRPSSSYGDRDRGRGGSRGGNRGISRGGGGGFGGGFGGGRGGGGRSFDGHRGSFGSPRGSFGASRGTFGGSARGSRDSSRDSRGFGGRARGGSDSRSFSDRRPSGGGFNESGGRGEGRGDGERPRRFFDGPRGDQGGRGGQGRGGTGGGRGRGGSGGNFSRGGGSRGRGRS